MPKPVTPFVGCDVFVQDEESRVLLIQRSDNQLWALPGGAQDLGETPAQCAVRECYEESGFEVSLVKLLGVWSSSCYEYVNYPWKENEFTHLLFTAEIVGGKPKTSEESLAVDWFTEDNLPALSDGHAERIAFGFRFAKDSTISLHFE